MKLWFWVTVLVGFIFLVKDVDANNNQHGNIDCELPFQPIGDSCLLIDNDLQGTWQTMKDICVALQGDLVSLADANLLYHISNYIKHKGLGKYLHDTYWVGANDLTEEEKWVWVSDNSSVEMGIPLWGNYPQNQPDGGVGQNCGVLDNNDFFYLHDTECDAIHGVICQKGDAGPSPPGDCPPSYEMIGGSCFRVYYDAIYDWHDNKNLCEAAGAHAAKIDDANLFGELYNNIIKDNEGCFWTGGSILSESSSDWLWHDGTPVPMGTPFWRVNDNTTQKPTLEYNYQCIAICYKDMFDESFRFNNLGCATPRLEYAMCQYDL